MKNLTFYENHQNNFGRWFEKFLGTKKSLAPNLIIFSEINIQHHIAVAQFPMLCCASSITLSMTLEEAISDQ